MRKEAVEFDNVPVCSQGGLMQSVMRIQAITNLKQNRLGWLTPDLKIAEKGDVFYFTGCVSYYDSIFKDRKNLNMSGIPQAVVKIMNKGGITPVVSNDEVCCGHDLNWTGDEDDFEKLMEHNIGLIKKSGAKKVVFTCPECYRTFKMDYQALAGDLGFELIHFADFVKELGASGALKLDPVRNDSTTFTYHDSCRLGRHSGIYDSPRELAKAFSGAKFVEMENTRDKAMCCGVSAWSNCNANAKKIQVDRVVEAKKSGASRMLMFCPKCQIHLKCAIQDKVPVDQSLVDVKIEDFTVALARLLDLMPDES